MTREQAIEILQNNQHTSPSWEAIGMAIEALKEQQPKWIPVDEKKPKSMANKVLVYLDHEDLVGYIGFGHYEKFQGEEMWYDLEHNEQFSKRGYTVTHWMPLPEPPKDDTH